MHFLPKADGAIPRSRVIAICGLLLLASAVNYMDRQTLAVTASRIKTEFDLNKEQYGNVEAAFGYSFALGSLFWGLVVDRFSVRWVYPIGLFGWSAMGFLTGWAKDYDDLLACRAFLGFFEASHWPCGLKTTQYLLSQNGRAMGNSVLQSGTSIGAIATPLVMLAVLTDEAGSWRVGFQGIAITGLLWIALWLFVVRAKDFRPQSLDVASTDSALSKPTLGTTSFWLDLLSRRFVLILLTVVAINIMWQLLRAWLPLIMQEHYGYGESQTLLFNSVWYAVTDIGCFGVGIATFWLGARGWSIKGSRLTVMAVCALGVASLIAVPWIQGGPLLLGILLLAGAGALGMFPLYYSFSQDVSRDHLGKVVSFATPIAWIASSRAQSDFGRLADQTGRFDIGLMLVGMLPIIPLIALWAFWPSDSAESHERVTT